MLVSTPPKKQKGKNNKSNPSQSLNQKSHSTTMKPWANVTTPWYPQANWKGQWAPDSPVKVQYCKNYQRTTLSTKNGSSYTMNHQICLSQSNLKAKLNGLRISDQCVTLISTVLIAKRKSQPTSMWLMVLSCAKNAHPNMTKSPKATWNPFMVKFTTRIRCVCWRPQGETKHFTTLWVSTDDTMTRICRRSTPAKLLSTTPKT